MSNDKASRRLDELPAELSSAVERISATQAPEHSVSNLIANATRSAEAPRPLRIEWASQRYKKHEVKIDNTFTIQLIGVLEVGLSGGNGWGNCPCTGALYEP